MLVLNNRFALLASLLTFLVLSTAPSTANAAAIRMRQNSSEDPTTTTLAGGTTYTQDPIHQDRPSELDLPDGAEPASSASRKGMYGGGRWDPSRTRTWTGTWTGTRTWSRPTSTAPATDSDDVDSNDELSKREFRDSDAVSKYSHRRHHARRYSQRGLASGHRSGSSKSSRRSISLDSDKGERYVVQKERSRTPSSAYRQRRFMMRRKNQRGTPGVVNIMSHVNNAQPGKKIASLYLESEKQNEQYVLNASEKDATEVYLVPTVPPAGGSLTAHRRDNRKQEMLVSLRVQIEDSEYCATYDPNPPEAEPLTMQPCMGVADESDDEEAAKDVDAGEDRDPDNHKSQTFSFDPDSGVIRPMWFAAEDNGTTDEAHVEDSPDDMSSSTVSSASPSSTASDAQSVSPSAVSSAVAADDTSVPTSVTASPSTRSDSVPSPTSTSTIAARDASAAQNVTLVFVPSSKPAAAAAANAVGDAPSSSLLASVPLPSASSASSDTETATPSPTATAASDDGEATSTLTMTVTVTASPTDSDSNSMPTATPDAAAKDASGDGASSTTTITISSSAAPPAPTGSRGGDAGSLSVQVVGDDGKTVGDDDPDTANPPMDKDASSPSSTSISAAPSSSASAPAPTAPAPPSAPVPVITGAPIPSIVNPMDVASSVAQSWSASQSASASSAAAASSVATSTLSSATSTQMAPDASRTEVVAVKSSKMINSRIARRMTPVSTAPYKWLFKFGGI